MRILFVEDNPRPAELVENFKLDGHIVDYMKNLSDAEYAVLFSPGAAVYDALFLDLHMSIRDLPEEHWELAGKTFAGWAFYKEILKPHPELQCHTVFFTAYANAFREVIPEDELQGVRILHKGDSSLISKARELLSELSGKSNTDPGKEIKGERDG